MSENVTEMSQKGFLTYLLGKQLTGTQVQLSSSVARVVVSFYYTWASFYFTTPGYICSIDHSSIIALYLSVIFPGDAEHGYYQ